MMILAAVTLTSFAKIALFILVLSVLVVLHEYGHFILARLSKVRVLEFSVGSTRRQLCSGQFFHTRDNEASRVSVGAPGRRSVGRR